MTSKDSQQTEGGENRYGLEIKPAKSKNPSPAKGLKKLKLPSQQTDWFDQIMLKHLGDTGWNGHTESKNYQSAKQAIESKLKEAIHSTILGDEERKELKAKLGINYG